MKSITLQIGMIVAVLIAAIWIARSDDLAPDAALIAQTLTGESRTVQAASWELARVTDRRLWLDVFGMGALAALDLSDVGAGVSADVTPGAIYCAGAGWWRDEWCAYAGAHLAEW